MKLMRLVTAGLVLGAFGSGALADAGAKALFEDSSGAVQAVPTARTEKGGPPQKKQQVENAQKFVGLKYWVELVKPNGKTEEKVVSYDFKSGDRIKIRVQPNTNGYIYAVNEGTSGRTNVLFPSRNNPSAYVKAGAVMTLPARVTLPLTTIRERKKSGWSCQALRLRTMNRCNRATRSHAPFKSPL